MFVAIYINKITKILITVELLYSLTSCQLLIEVLLAIITD